MQGLLDYLQIIRKYARRKEDYESPKVSLQIPLKSMADPMDQVIQDTGHQKVEESLRYQELLGVVI